MQLSEPQSIQTDAGGQTWNRGAGHTGSLCSVAEARRRTAVCPQAARPAAHIGGGRVRRSCVAKLAHVRGCQRSPAIAIQAACLFGLSA